MSTTPRRTWRVLGAVLLATMAALLGPSAMTQAGQAASAPKPGVESLMADSGCASWTVTKTHPRAYGSGRCVIDGRTVTFGTFTTDVLRDQWIRETASQGGRVAVADGLAARAPTYTLTRAIADRLHGWIV